MEVKYIGNASGQGKSLKIGGYKFTRGQITNVAASDIEPLRLDNRAGFEVKKKKVATPKKSGVNSVGVMSRTEASSIRSPLRTPGPTARKMPSLS